MHWTEACKKSKYNAAVRVDAKYKKSMRRTYVGCTVAHENTVRNAKPGEDEGFLDWEPETRE